MGTTGATSMSFRFSSKRSTLSVSWLSSHPISMPRSRLRARLPPRLVVGHGILGIIAVIALRIRAVIEPPGSDGLVVADQTVGVARLNLFHHGRASFQKRSCDST